MTSCRTLLLGLLLAAGCQEEPGVPELERPFAWCYSGASGDDREVQHTSITAFATTTGQVHMMKFATEATAADLDQNVLYRVATWSGTLDQWLGGGSIRFSDGTELSSCTRRDEFSIDCDSPEGPILLAGPARQAEEAGRPTCRTTS